MDGPVRGVKDLRGLVPLVTKEEQLCWAEKIKSHVPHCVTMYNNLMQHGHGHVCHDTIYVLHGHPSSQAVISEKKISPTTQHVGIFCLEEEVDQVIEVLGEIINWRDAKKSIAIHHIPPYMSEPLQQLTDKMGVKMNLSSCTIFTYDPRLDTQVLRVGNGFRVCRLGKGGIRHLYETAKYTHDMSLEMMYSLAERLPFIGVYRDTVMTQDTTVDVVNLPLARDEEMPIAWVCSGTCGEVAMLMIEEKFRKRGLGSLITTIMARRQAAILGFIPHAFIERENSASRAMLSKTAGWNPTHEAFWMENKTIAEMNPGMLVEAACV